MATIKEDRKVLDKLLINARLSQLKEVEAGSFGSGQHPTFDGTIASLAAMYEFGFTREDGQDVIASFMQPVDWSTRNYQSALNRTLQKIAPLILTGKISITDALDQIGAIMAQEYKNYISDDEVQMYVSDQFVPKKDGTRLIKSSSILDSISHEVR